MYFTLYSIGRNGIESANWLDLDKMYNARVVAMLFAALIPLMTVCHDQMEIDCAFPNATVLESVYNSTNLDFGEGSGSPSVNVTNFHPVCLAHSLERDLYRYASFVLEYAITNCYNEACPTETQVEQIDIACVGGVWMRQGLMNDTMATFSTTTKEDCAFCVSPQLISNVGASIVADNITHCVGKTSYLFCQ